MSRTWELTDLEFQLLCDDHRHGVLPAPFSFTSRTALLADYERERAAARDRLRDRADGEFEAMVDTVARPEVFVVAHAWDDQDFENPDKRIRVHAVRRGSRGYVLDQKPGETLWHSGGFTITECGPRELSEAVVDRLPRRGPGRRGAIPIVVSETPAPERVSGSMVADDEDDEQFTAARFFDTPAVSTGIVKVLQGRSKFGPRGLVESGVLWRDLPHDGRYVMPLDDPAPIAVGTGSDGLVGWITSAIERILARMDSHRELEV
ncbi:ESX secretion-associated protein EspG [Nocardia sp. NPDC004068]|uniref:ESX secretion-associated protein EspG n=1 Tax=Nocardia sp. NPDC004068 TaxID=3364303 RepID=UPI003694FD65